MEQHFGARFGTDDPGGVRVIAGVIYVAIRRVDPKVTVEDVRGMPPEVFAGVAEQVDDAGPPAEQPESSATSGAGSGQRSASRG